MVPDTPDVERVLFGENGIASGLSKGKIVVDMSSISPISTKEFAKKINALGCDYLDAPVSGGEVGAKNATLSIMAGGDETVFEKIKPIFELMGKNINLVGGNGDGQTAKVANQIIVAFDIERALFLFLHQLDDQRLVIVGIEAGTDGDDGDEEQRDQAACCNERVLENFVHECRPNNKILAQCSTKRVVEKIQRSVAKNPQRDEESREI